MPIPVEPIKAAGSFLKEFRAFVIRGPLVDMAVGVVAGAAFSRLIDSLVKNVLMKALEYVLPDARAYEAWTIGNVEVGKFLAELLYFVVVGFAVFFVIVKVGGLLTRSRQRQQQEDAAAAAAAATVAAKLANKVPPADVVLLTEIRDLLRQQQQQRNQARSASPSPPSFQFRSGDENLLI